jgi:hypothetical protein
VLNTYVVDPKHNYSLQDEVLNLITRDKHQNTILPQESSGKDSTK